MSPYNFSSGQFAPPLQDERFVLNHVYSELVEASNDWFDLGLALDIQHSTLEGLEHYRDSKTCLREMLACWFKTKSSPLTWDHLCKCLRKSIVKRHDIADQIERKYKGIVYILDQLPLSPQYSNLALVPDLTFLIIIRLIATTGSAKVLEHTILNVHG